MSSLWIMFARTALSLRAAVTNSEPFSNFPFIVNAPIGHGRSIANVEWELR
jgi:hypothetical protein